MGMMKEFKEFAMRGNVMDMAIGIIIGAAFGKIISSFVGDVLMPPIGLLLGNMDFSNIVITLKEVVGDVPAVTMKIGMFINYIIDFLIVAFVIYLVIRGLNAMKKKQAAAPPPPPPGPSNEEKLLGEIRDLLKK
jgi:large conductance mechanosensitive channel